MRRRSLLLGASSGLLTPTGSRAWTHGAAKYLGAVSMRTGYLPNQTFGPSTSQQMAVSMHVLTDNITSIQIAWPNFYMFGGVENSGGAATFTAGVRIQGGPSLTQVTWSSSSTLSTSAMVTPLCDPIAITASAGQTLEVRCWRSGPTIGAIMIFPPNDNINSAYGEGFEWGATESDRTVNGGSVSASGAPAMYLPCLIVGQTAKATCIFYGDSRGVGYEDSLTDASGNLGEWARSLGLLNIGHCNCGVAGDQFSRFLTSNSARLSLAPYFTHIGSQYGFNDLIAGALTPSQVFAELQSMMALSAFSGKPFLQSTIPTDTQSSDGWATLANQSFPTTSCQTFSTLVKANGGPLLLFATPDIANVVQNSGGLWLAPPIPTPDGVHENSTSAGAIQNSGCFTSAMFQR